MRIAFLLYEGLTALDAVGPLEVLARLPGARTDLVSAGPDLVTTDTGATALQAGARLVDVPAADVVVVPGGAGTRRALADAELRAWLQDVAAGARWVTSVCTGSLLLGAAGLLQGRRATTHWALLDELEGYGATPAAGRFVVDGPVVTAAGVSAGIDMALWLAGQLAGKTTARLLQLALEYDPAPPYRAGSPEQAGRLLTAAGRRAVHREFNAPLPAA